MLNIKQIAVIASVITVMGALLSMDIKGLVKPKSSHNTGGTAANEQGQVSKVTIESISQLSKEGLNANIVQEINDLENSLKSASAEKKQAVEKSLAQKWDDVNLSAPAAFYYEMLAKDANNYASWIKAGDKFTDGYQNTQDTLAQPGLVQKAINAYQKAMEIQPNSLDAKTGLGVAYVSGTESPMQGIQLLLGVVKEDPNNIKANMNLGLFSMKSGQFEKAVTRFKTVNSVKATPESWFYLASSYENLGQKTDAIAAYEKSKEMAADPGLSKFVDKKIIELKK